MTKDTLIARLREFTLFVTTVASMMELMHHYSIQQDKLKVQQLGDFLRVFALGNADSFNEFDDYIHKQRLVLLADDELLPLLIKYLYAKAQFNEILEDLHSDVILDAELLTV